MIICKHCPLNILSKRHVVRVMYLLLTECMSGIINFIVFYCIYITKPVILKRKGFNEENFTEDKQKQTEIQ